MPSIRSLALLGSFGLASAASVLSPRSVDLDSCPGYNAKNVKENKNGFVADLTLAGKACDAYGKDLKDLKLEVTYDSNTRIHVKITDPEGKRYEVPESVVPRPTTKATGSAKKSDIVFEYKQSPFSFSITRRSTGEKLFDTTGNALIFESQYLRLKTNLPENPNIYGLGEHTESLRLNPTNTTRTLWSRDSYGVPQDSNLYGNHPVYYEHRDSGTHGVLMLNSNGMDIKLRNSNTTGAYSLEYNIIGGILDLYFFAGPDPIEVAKQYSEVVGLPAMMPYWGFGFHQCRYGYRDWIDVAEVIANYSMAGIPLETMWTDIDYMYERWVFTLDPERFPVDKVREIVDYLHAHDQHYIVMVDPAIAYQDYPAFNRALESDTLLKEANGTVHKGVVWPGVTAYPDWFHPNIESYWNNEFAEFFNADTGVDIDGVWIDMNEPASFCSYPCSDPEGEAIAQQMPPKRLPVRDPPRSIPGFPSTYSAKKTRSIDAVSGAPNKVRARRASVEVDLISPPYSIANDAPYGLSDRTVHTDIVHYGGYLEYDTHNLYGTMMSDATYDAMSARRPGLRPLIITRSTFAGAGKKVGKWLGDNLSTWEQYRWSIPGMLGFASFYQIPMVGSDVCGFGANTTETLCARWATLGAFNPFFRNHNGDTSISQEFYRWPMVVKAAKNAIDIRYRLLDYIYTAMYKQHKTGVPLINPLFFKYPKDKNVYDIEYQFVYGDSILVSPVTAENVTTVDIYLPQGQFYEFTTGKSVKGEGKFVTLTDVDYDTIPLHIIGGSILPLRSESAMTTTELRTKPFNLIIAPDSKGYAEGSLYVDDGESLEQEKTLSVEFVYKNKKLSVKCNGRFSGVKVEKVTLLGASKKRSRDVDENGVLVVEAEKELSGEWTLDF